MLGDDKAMEVAQGENKKDNGPEEAADPPPDPVEMEYSDVEPGELPGDEGPSVEEKFEHVAAENRKMREVLGQWEQYRAAVEAEQRGDRGGGRERRPARAEEEADDVGDSGQPPDRSGVNQSDEIRDLREQIAGLEQKFSKTLHERDLNRSQREAKQQVATVLDAIREKHGDIISDVEIYKEWRKAPEITADRAAQIVLHRRLAAMKGRYAVAAPKPKPAPFVPGMGALRMPTWTPPKAVASEEDFDEAYDDMIKHQDDRQ